jgi:hypothetical protein
MNTKFAVVIGMAVLALPPLVSAAPLMPQIDQ